MKPINNWENVKAVGGFEALPAGGCVCEIKKATEKPNKNSAGTHLELMIDIAEGEYAGFYERDYKANTAAEKFWRGIIRQNVPVEGSEKYEMQCRFFKRFISDVEDSNSGYHWTWDENTLKGKKIGVIFRAHEKESKTGNVYTVTYADSMTTVANIRAGTFKVPDVKKLAKSAAAPFEGFADLGSSSGFDLPF